MNCLDYCLDEFSLSVTWDMLERRTLNLCLSLLKVDFLDELLIMSRLRRILVFRGVAE